MKSVGAAFVGDGITADDYVLGSTGEYEQKVVVEYAEQFFTDDPMEDWFYIMNPDLTRNRTW